MILGIWGKKLGMTQVFDQDQVVPVTVIDVSDWVVTGTKTQERDGYNAIQVGCLRKRFAGQKALASWFKKPQQYFGEIREIPVKEIPANIAKGQVADFYGEIQKGDQVNVFGITRGRGFAGVVKRHRFRGSPASHGSTMGKNPGSLSFMRSQGRSTRKSNS